MAINPANAIADTAKITNMNPKPGSKPANNDTAATTIKHISTPRRRFAAWDLLIRVGP